tara:strand:- start:330 stop:1568 length:1239 start_codon:yes stop_codon:yes gene_type:complete
MLSLFKKSSFVFKRVSIFLILINLIYPQQISSNLDFEFNSSESTNWWDIYNNEGLLPSDIKLEYTFNHSHRNIESNLSLFYNDNDFFLGESFSKIFLNDSVYFKIGKYFRDFSQYLNDDLSSGHMLISKNAQPMPKIGLVINYSLKKNQYIDFKFGISHANLDKNLTYKSSPFLHEKFIYLKNKKEDREWGIGLVHEAIWGGETYEYGEFPSSFNDYLKIFISADGPLLDGDAHANALGNHLGIWDFYFQKNYTDKIFKAYYQHFFEDTSGLRFANKYDGLWGIEIDNYIKNLVILVEYLSTINQDPTDDYLIDSYYNHTQYLDGWSYKNFVLGNPFIDNLDQNPSEVIHIGLLSKNFSDYFYQINLSRRINVNDNLKYKIIFGKKFSNISIKLFLSEDYESQLGLGLSYQL